MEDQVLVSVYCLAYNHEKYIRNALEGFVTQKTDFKYEVFVHDDASTDGTADIIREYAEKYPDIIKPILQTENQYSKKVRITKTFILPKMSGMYIAPCEGDDAWISPDKLQRQVDFMKAHPEYSICVHQAYKQNEATGERTLFTKETADRDYTTEEIICGGGGLFSTNSMFMRAEDLKQMPVFDNRPGTGDYQMMIHFAMSGKLHYLAEPMSLYRLGVSGSWTQRCYSNTEQKVAAQKQAIEMLQKADQYYHLEQHQIFQKAIRIKQYKIERIKGNRSFSTKLRFWDAAKNDFIPDLYRAVKARCPGLIRILARIRKAIVGEGKVGQTGE